MPVVSPAVPSPHRQGDHVLLREFEYVNATPRNRLAFVRMAVEAYQNINEDFPTQYHDDAAKQLREASGNSQNLFPYKKIAACWQFIAQVKDQFPPSTLQVALSSLRTR
eukprot:752400-Hanusia_phi.AAC.1